MNIVKGMVAVDRFYFNRHKIKYIKNDLTVYPKSFESSDDIPDPIKLYDITDKKIYLPYAYAINKGIDINVYCWSFRNEINCNKLPDPNHPSVQYPDLQKRFMWDIYKALKKYKRIIANASTGIGKTVCSLWVAGKLKKKFAVIVDMDGLAKQWREEIHDKLGIPYNKIGLVQGNKCDYKDKDCVVIMVQTLFRRKELYTDDFYDEFGLIIYDEVHVFGARTFSETMKLFSAKYQIGLSATLERPDNCSECFFQHLASKIVQAEIKPVKTEVYYINYNHKEFTWGRNHGARMKCLTLIKNRNLLLAKIIKRLYNNDNDILILSFNIRHLEALMELCSDEIPDNDMGLYATTDSNKKVLKKDYLSDVLENKKVIFATYNKFKKAIDLPRLNVGVEATPNTNPIQVAGRIRRYKKNKKKCMWVSIKDICMYRDPNRTVFLAYQKKHERTIVKENVEIKK